MILYKVTVDTHDGNRRVFNKVQKVEIKTKRNIQELIMIQADGFKTENKVDMGDIREINISKYQLSGREEE